MEEHIRRESWNHPEGIGIWEVGSREKLVLKNFKVNYLSAVSISQQWTIKRSSHSADRRELTDGFTTSSPPTSAINIVSPQSVTSRKGSAIWEDQVKMCADDGLEGSIGDGYSRRNYIQRDIFGAKFPRNKGFNGEELEMQLMLALQELLLISQRRNPKHKKSKHKKRRKKTMKRNLLLKRKKNQNREIHLCCLWICIVLDVPKRLRDLY
uniref:Probable WRKY transcription factor 53 n=1 Tax=Tanacetum cinerariifolium TaxID=118510 RepID=A0A6L2NP97_TANCI|nr:probable WRKY transcription factor 53 [Tanacetum cinerariifolium]